jgi:hypothetical protein
VRGRDCGVERLREETALVTRGVGTKTSTPVMVVERTRIVRWLHDLLPTV